MIRERWARDCVQHILDHLSAEGVFDEVRAGIDEAQDRVCLVVRKGDKRLEQPFLLSSIGFMYLPGVTAITGRVLREFDVWPDRVEREQVPA